MNDAEVQDILALRHRWPLVDRSENAAAFSGMACLTVILRSIVSCLAKKYKDELLGGNNPITELVSRPLASSTPAQEKDNRDDRDAAFARLVEIFGTDKLPFEVLAESSLMRETFWSLNRSASLFELFHKVRFRYPGEKEDKWYALEGTYGAALREPVVDWDGSRSLAETIEAKFCTKSLMVLNREAEVELLFNKPFLIRVRFTPKQRQDLNFQNVKPLTITTKKEAALEEIQQAHYRLVGVVRLRSSRKEPDYVRCYDVQGKPLLPVGGLTGYEDDVWRLADQDRTYMLYYMAAHNLASSPVTPYVEVGRRRSAAARIFAAIINSDLALSMATDPRWCAARISSGPSTEDEEMPAAPASRAASPYMSSGRSPEPPAPTSHEDDDEDEEMPAAPASLPASPSRSSGRSSREPAAPTSHGDDDGEASSGEASSGEASSGEASSGEAAGLGRSAQPEVQIEETSPQSVTPEQAATVASGSPDLSLDAAPSTEEPSQDAVTRHAALAPQQPAAHLRARDGEVPDSQGSPVFTPEAGSAARIEVQATPGQKNPVQQEGPTVEANVPAEETPLPYEPMAGYSFSSDTSRQSGKVTSRRGGIESLIHDDD